MNISAVPVWVPFMVLTVGFMILTIVRFVNDARNVRRCDEGERALIAYLTHLHEEDYEKAGQLVTQYRDNPIFAAGLQLKTIIDRIKNETKLSK